MVRRGSRIHSAFRTAFHDEFFNSDGSADGRRAGRFLMDWRSGIGRSGEDHTLTIRCEVRLGGIVAVEVRELKDVRPIQ